MAFLGSLSGQTRKGLRTAVRTVQFLAAFHIVWEYGFSPRLCMGPSMLPTFEVADEVLLVSHLHRHGRGVRVGDLVHCKVPINESEGVKRVLGMPGDYVMVDTPESGSEAMIQVPAGHCWVVGDNLPASRDSRSYGPIPLGLVQGKIIAKTWPFWKFEWVKNPLPRPSST